MNILDLITRKRDGERLDADEIAWLIDAYTRGRFEDYQMAAMLMAVFIRGLDADELSAWTSAMLHSGEVLDFSSLSRPKADKHSTGGVGDKISIPLAPTVAACGVAIPMISGRGLGHTGGTLDKLETIPGFRTAIDPGDFATILAETGLVLAGQSETLVPADRLIYALRDVTGTVPSIPLIASSIMSKKLAEGIDALVLDVKVGEGAFMRTIEDARDLARTMVGIGAAYGTATSALITDMNQPLGRAVGNANEIAESVEVLNGGGPPDVVELVMALGAEMLVQTGVAPDADTARQALGDAISSGRALETLVDVARAQGGDPACLYDPSLLPRADGEIVVTAERDGIVERCNAYDIGLAAVRLGAGRAVIEEVIDPAVGLTIEARIGMDVSAGDPLVRIHYNDEGRVGEAERLVRRALVIGDGPVAAPTLIHEEIR
ncbi:MAG: thymidine phosphorylase [Acidimicrobiia bacterium]